MQERERAEDTLQQGISMKQGDLDAYIAEYEVLVEMVGYDPNSRLTLKIFTDGLPTELYKDALRLDRPRNYAEWKEAALTRHAEWVHFKHRSEQKRGVKLFNPFKPQYQPPRDPNAMNTSADRTRARQIEAELGEEHARVYAPEGEDCYDSGSDFSARLLTGYDYGTPQVSSHISHGQSSQSAG